MQCNTERTLLWTAHRHSPSFRQNNATWAIQRGVAVTLESRGANGRAMRVVAGEVKGHRLRAPKGLETRPTSDKVRGAIFNILAGEFVDQAILDLFAGTGALGIEALSRGASRAVFVEERRAACQVIRANLEHTGFRTLGHVMEMPVDRALPLLEETYGLVLLDPPYAFPHGHAIMAAIGGARVIGNDTRVVFEHSPRFAVEERYARLALQRQRVYGDTAISFFVVQES